MMCCLHFITVLSLSLVCYETVFFIVLLQRFIYVDAIHIGKTNSISRRYQIIVVRMLKNLNRRYSNYYIIKFIGFMPIYANNLDTVSLFMVLSDLYLESIDLLQV